MRKPLTAIASSALLGSLALSAAVAEKAPIRELPIEGPFFMQETASGSTVLISEDGRYVLPGRVVDRERDHALITSIEEVDEHFGDATADPETEPAVSREAEDTGPTNSDGEILAENLLRFTVGDEESDRSEVFVFFDPQCPHCHSTLSLQDELSDEYTFHNVLVATMGEESEEGVLALSCMAEDQRKAAVVDGEIDLAATDQSDCASDLSRNSEALYRMTEAHAVPAIINPDFQLSVGAPQTTDQLRAFLQGEEG